MNVLDVAEMLISQCRNEGITHYKLQKLLYYVQGFYLAIHKNHLFDAPIIACSTGVRVDEVYNKYSKFRFENIPCYKIFQLDMNTEVHKRVYDVCLIFKYYHAGVMEELIMSEDPWIRAWGDRGIYAPGVVMDITDIKEYFINEYL